MLRGVRQDNYAGQTVVGLNTRAVMYGLLVLGGLLIALVAARFGFAAGMIFAMVPIGLVVVFGIIANPYWGMIAMFVANYFVMGVQRYLYPLPVGIAMDLLLGLTLLGVFIQMCYSRLDMKMAANGLTLASGIWMLYCFLQLFNLEGPPGVAWLTSIRGVALYFFVIPILVQVLFGNYRDLKRIIYLWSAFTLIAVLKAYIQKNFGFDAYEYRWLYLRGESTHLIQTGARFFSIFTDAGNFGANMGFSMVSFSIMAMVFKNWKVKAYFLAVAAAAAYGMMISGTRGAIAVPFAGYATYVLLSRNWKVIIFMSLLIAGAFYFFNNTYLMHGNAYVRRMRGAFNPNDPSLVVRLDNQEKMRKYLRSRPFGVGIGMGGVKAKTFAPLAVMSNLPTDSWYVMIWVETGIVGLTLYLGILLYLLIKSAYIIMFRIKDRTLRGVLGGLLAGIVGIMAASYGHELMGQFPAGILLYTFFAFIFLGPHMDRQLQRQSETENTENGGK